jgi:hypothetical protein
MFSRVGALGPARRASRASNRGAFRWDRAVLPVGEGLVARVRRRFEPAASNITVFHVTHHKAGSQWINRILHGLAHDRLVIPEVRDQTINVQFFERSIRPGAVYPTVYVTREQFESVAIPKDSRWFVVIRDLRDTLVSAYFSIKHSHQMTTDHELRSRGHLHAMSVGDGMLHLIDVWLPERAAMQRSWIGGPDHILKYEDLLQSDEEILERVLLGHCRLPVNREKLREALFANRFEARSGRKLGQEDVSSHERKGIAGDWKNHFTDKIAKAFKERFGELLVATGYETDSRW